MQRSGEEDFEQETKQNIKLQKPHLRKEQTGKKSGRNRAGAREGGGRV